jgi:UDP-N-acetylglucosamine pyrophosphorylase
MDAHWYVPNEIIRKDLHIPAVKKRSAALELPIYEAPQHAPQLTHSKSSTTSKKKAIAKTPANRNAEQFQYVIIVVTLVIKA